MLRLEDIVHLCIGAPVRLLPTHSFSKRFRTLPPTSVRDIIWMDAIKKCGDLEGLCGDRQDKGEQRTHEHEQTKAKGHTPQASPLALPPTVARTCAMHKRKKTLRAHSARRIAAGHYNTECPLLVARRLCCAPKILDEDYEDHHEPIQPRRCVEVLTGAHPKSVGASFLYSQDSPCNGRPGREGGGLGAGGRVRG